MSGILDPKTRILDTVVTLEGRRQIASGKLKAEFFSFTDAGTYYALTDTNSTSSDTRILLESSNLPQDQITFETDDSGKLVVKELRQVSGSIVSVVGGQFFSGSNSLSSSQELNDIAYSLLSSSIDNFNNLYLLGSSDLVEDKPNTFQVFPTEFSFGINSETELPEGSLDNIESLFADKRMSHVPNYQYLPPVNKARPGQAPNPLGQFVKLNQEPIETFADLNLGQLQSQEVSFLETSPQNRVVCQFFELASNKMTKLDVIDFGVFTTPDSQETKHVFFAGKLFVDSFGSHTFVNMFTLVWS
jgi:hypothetical protein